MVVNREYAKALWFTVAGVIGIFAVANVLERTVCWLRYIYRYCQS